MLEVEKHLAKVGDLAGCSDEGLPLSLGGAEGLDLIKELCLRVLLFAIDIHVFIHAKIKSWFAWLREDGDHELEVVLYDSHLLAVLSEQPPQPRVVCRGQLLCRGQLRSFYRLSLRHLSWSSPVVVVRISPFYWLFFSLLHVFFSLLCLY
jgi:hypothetical protein